MTALVFAFGVGGLASSTGIGCLTRFGCCVPLRSELKVKAVIQLARYLLIAALMVSIGAQWAVLQSVAWVGMAVSYSMKEGSITTGLSQTFDGEHPCALCCAVKKGTESEKKDPKSKDSKKLKQDLFASESRAVVIAAPHFVRLPQAANEVALARFGVPAVPPPRSV